MSDELKLIALVFAKNTAMVICFTVLAIVFKHWWIILFSAFFLSSFKSREEDK